MATAYAVLTSLSNLIKQIHDHPYPPIPLDEKQFDSLSSKIDVFQKFLEVHHSSIDDKLASELADAAHAAEDLIDNHLTDRIQDRVDLHRSLEKVMEDLDLMAMETNRNGQSQVNDATSGEKVVVGEQDIATKFMDKLTQQIESGMGGIGHELHKKQVDSLRSKIRHLRGILEDRKTVDHVLESQIADAARNAEGCIETHIAGRVRYQEEFRSGLQRVIEDMDPIEKEVMKMNRLSDAAHTVEDLIDTHSAGRVQDRVVLHRSLEKVMKDLDHMAMEMNPSEQSQGNVHPSATSDESVVVGEEDMAAKILAKLIQQLESGMGGIAAYEFHKKQVYSLCSKIRDLQKLLEDRKTVDHGLESRVADTTHNAKAAIDRKDPIEKEVMEMDQKEESQVNNQPTQQPVPLDSSQSRHHTDSGLVGIKEITEKIMHKLTRPTKSDRQMITITGMGGIGKTTLALNVYEQSIIKEKFDKYRAWASVSRDYNIKDILVELLHCLDSQRSNEILGLDSEHKLRENLHKFLINQKYLIVLDDVWDAEVWESLKRSIPATSGSGIVITTRLGTIANSIGSESEEMDFLDEGQSWELFRKNAFRQYHTCPPELEEIGKTIAKKCDGLPLSIVVIGGYLAESSRLEDWNHIAGNLSEVVKSKDERCRRILSLSYTRMPVHLKPCFLYMAVFPEDKVIRASRIIRLWVAEGFLKPIDNKSLEETAEEYLKDLVRRNLILSSTPFSKGKIKSCKMHDLVRDLCVDEAHDKNFLCIAQKIGIPNNGRRIVEHPNASKREYPSDIVDVVKSQAPHLRTFVIDGITPLLENRLLRVLAPTTELRSIRLPKLEAGQCSWNLRYVECMESIWDAYLRQAIFHPWNLQYLFIAPIFTNPQPDIWEMPHLRRIKTKYLFLSRPPSESNVVMRKLKSAKTIINFSFCEEVVERIPNIKKLAVRYIEGLKGFNEGAYTLNNVKGLEYLESFRCFLDLKSVELSRILGSLALPSSLKKLNFRSLRFEDVTSKIASLPNLEVLKLCDCSGSEWTLNEEGFRNLKHLQLYDCWYLKSFDADREYFPCLESLVLVNLDSLEEITFGVEDTLKSLQVKFCPDEVVDRAKEFADEQHNNSGSEGLEVTVFLLRESRLSKSELEAKYFRVNTYDGSDGV